MQLRETHLLHPDYSKAFNSCSQEEWMKWLASGHAGLLTFLPLIQKREYFYGKPQIEQEARGRGIKEKLNFYYVTHKFLIEDWDFEDLIWTHWQSVAAEDQHFWTKVINYIFSQRDTYWNHAGKARLLQIATTGKTRSITNEPLLSKWVLRLRELLCLPDTRGFPHKPGDLLRRTLETESLMDVEPFVHGHFDRETTPPLLY